MTGTDDVKLMQEALALAEKGRGKVAPNPMVGAVVAKNGRIIGRGYHRRAGDAHAEIMALKKAGDDARGAELFVTLEPCCHYGRTGPCTEAIIDAGIKRVVFARKDPNPRVNGRGSRILKKAGLEVVSGLLAKEAGHLNEVYSTFITTGKPFVILKTAQTLDGWIASKEGNSKWITDVKSRRFVHRLRSECDAVMVGAGTVRADNPRLTVRRVKGRQPYRIIVSSHPKLGGHLNLLQDNHDAKTILATTRKKSNDVKYDRLITWGIKSNRRGLVLDDLLEVAGQFGITSILVEGGSRLAASFLRAGLVHKHYLFIAPRLMGEGIPAYADLNIRTLEKAVNYRRFEYRSEFLPDLLFIGYPRNGRPA